MEVGSEILVYVVNPENNDGQAILSLSRARAEQGWRVLQKLMDAGDTIEAEVVDYNKGGLIAITEGVRGFVPASQIVSLRSIDDVDPSEANPALAAMIGAKLQLKVLEVNRRRNRLVLSERAAMQEVRAQQREKLIEGTEGRRDTARSGNKHPKILEPSWTLGAQTGWYTYPSCHGIVSTILMRLVKVGIEVDVYVMNVDPRDEADCAQSAPGPAGTLGRGSREVCCWPARRGYRDQARELWRLCAASRDPSKGLFTCRNSPTAISCIRRKWSARAIRSS